MYTSAMPLQKFRWSKVYESSEEELANFLAARNIAAQRYEIAGLETTKHFIEQTTLYWCAEGSMVVWEDGNNTSLQPGDTVRIPAMSTIELRAGMSGCAYYESTSPDHADTK